MEEDLGLSTVMHDVRPYLSPSGSLRMSARKRFRSHGNSFLDDKMPSDILILRLLLG